MDDEVYKKQIQAFVKCINYQLANSGQAFDANEISRLVSNSQRLLQLVQVVAGSAVLSGYPPPSSLPVQKKVLSEQENVENIRYLLLHLVEGGVPVEDVSSRAPPAPPDKAGMANVVNAGANELEKAIRRELVAFVRTQINTYAEFEINRVTDLGSSLADGRVICVLVDSLNPGIVNVGAVCGTSNKTEAEKYVSKAISIAQTKFQLPSLCEAQDVLYSPQERILLPFVAYLRSKHAEVSQSRHRRRSSAGGSAAHRSSSIGRNKPSPTATPTSASSSSSSSSSSPSTSTRSISATTSTSTSSSSPSLPTRGLPVTGSTSPSLPSRPLPSASSSSPKLPSRPLPSSSSSSPSVSPNHSPSLPNRPRLQADRRSPTPKVFVNDAGISPAQPRSSSPLVHTNVLAAASPSTTVTYNVLSSSSSVGSTSPSLLSRVLSSSSSSSSSPPTRVRVLPPTGTSPPLASRSIGVSGSPSSRVPPSSFSTNSPTRSKPGQVPVANKPAPSSTLRSVKPVSIGNAHSSQVPSQPKVANKKKKKLYEGTGSVLSTFADVPVSQLTSLAERQLAALAAGEGDEEDDEQENEREREMTAGVSMSSDTPPSSSSSSSTSTLANVPSRKYKKKKRPYAGTMTVANVFDNYPQGGARAAKDEDEQGGASQSSSAESSRESTPEPGQTSNPPLDPTASDSSASLSSSSSSAVEAQPSKREKKKRAYQGTMTVAHTYQEVPDAQPPPRGLVAGVNMQKEDRESENLPPRDIRFSLTQLEKSFFENFEPPPATAFPPEPEVDKAKSSEYDSLYAAALKQAQDNVRRLEHNVYSTVLETGLPASRQLAANDATSKAFAKLKQRQQDRARGLEVGDLSLSDTQSLLADSLFSSYLSMNLPDKSVLSLSSSSLASSSLSLANSPFMSSSLSSFSSGASPSKRTGPKDRAREAKRKQREGELATQTREPTSHPPPLRVVSEEFTPAAGSAPPPSHADSPISSPSPPSAVSSPNGGVLAPSSNPGVKRARLRIHGRSMSGSNAPTLNSPSASSSLSELSTADTGGTTATRSPSSSAAAAVADMALSAEQLKDREKVLAREQREREKQREREVEVCVCVRNLLTSWVAEPNTVVQALLLKGVSADGTVDHVIIETTEVSSGDANPCFLRPLRLPTRRARSLSRSHSNSSSRCSSGSRNSRRSHSSSSSRNSSRRSDRERDIFTSHSIGYPGRSHSSLSSREAERERDVRYRALYTHTLTKPSFRPDTNLSNYSVGSAGSRNANLPFSPSSSAAAMGSTTVSDRERADSNQFTDSFSISRRSTSTSTPQSLSHNPLAPSYRRHRHHRDRTEEEDDRERERERPHRSHTSHALRHYGHDLSLSHRHHHPPHRSRSHLRNAMSPPPSTSASLAHASAEASQQSSTLSLSPTAASGVIRSHSSHLVLNLQTLVQGGSGVGGVGGRGGGGVRSREFDTPPHTPTDTHGQEEDLDVMREQQKGRERESSPPPAVVIAGLMSSSSSSVSSGSASAQSGSSLSLATPAAPASLIASLSLSAHINAGLLQSLSLNTASLPVVLLCVYSVEDKDKEFSTSVPEESKAPPGISSSAHLIGLSVLSLPSLRKLRHKALHSPPSATTSILSLLGMGAPSGGVATATWSVPLLTAPLINPFDATIHKRLSHANASILLASPASSLAHSTTPSLSPRSRVRALFPPLSLAPDASAEKFDPAELQAASPVLPRRALSLNPPTGTSPSFTSRSLHAPPPLLTTNLSQNSSSPSAAMRSTTPLRFHQPPSPGAAPQLQRAQTPPSISLGASAASGTATSAPAGSQAPASTLALAAPVALSASAATPSSTIAQPSPVASPPPSSALSVSVSPRTSVSQSPRPPLHPPRADKPGQGSAAATPPSGSPTRFDEKRNATAPAGTIQAALAAGPGAQLPPSGSGAASSSAANPPQAVVLPAAAPQLSAPASAPTSPPGSSAAGAVTSPTRRASFNPAPPAFPPPPALPKSPPPPPGRGSVSSPATPAASTGPASVATPATPPQGMHVHRPSYTPAPPAFPPPPRPSVSAASPAQGRNSVSAPGTSVALSSSPAPAPAVAASPAVAPPVSTATPPRRQSSKKLYQGTMSMAGTFDNVPDTAPGAPLILAPAPAVAASASSTSPALNSSPASGISHTERPKMQSDRRAPAKKPFEMTLTSGGSASASTGTVTNSPATASYSSSSSSSQPTSPVSSNSPPSSPSSSQAVTPSASLSSGPVITAHSLQSVARVHFTISCAHLPRPAGGFFKKKPNVCVCLLAKLALGGSGAMQQEVSVVSSASISGRPSISGVPLALVGQSEIIKKDTNPHFTKQLSLTITSLHPTATDVKFCVYYVDGDRIEPTQLPYCLAVMPLGDMRVAGQKAYHLISKESGIQKALSKKHAKLVVFVRPVGVNIITAHPPA